MKRWWSRKPGHWGFVAGFVAAALLFGSLGFAETVAKQITVYYRPLRYVFDGMPKEPPEDQLGFIYDGRTFVSLRFISEALGKKVEWDGETSTIYVGRRPLPAPAMWEGYEVEGPVALQAEYYETGMKDVAGEDRPDALLLTAVLPEGQTGTDDPIYFKKEFTIEPGQKRFKGTIFIPDHYFGHKESRRVAKLTIHNQNNTAMYYSEILNPAEGPAHYSFDVSLLEISKVTVYVTLYPTDGLPYGNGTISRVGLSDFRFE